MTVPSEPFICIDERWIPARASDCFARLRRIREYGRWWRLVAIEPFAGGDLLEAGSEFDFVGRRRKSGEVTRWRCVVRAVVTPRGSKRGGGDAGVHVGRIDLEYVGPDLEGPTGWEVEPVPERGGTLVRYAYRGVRAMTPEAARSFAEHGTRLHSWAMQHDALAGLARVLGGPGSELSDERWDEHVQAAMANYAAGETDRARGRR